MKDENLFALTAFVGSPEGSQYASARDRSCSRIKTKKKKFKVDSAVTQVFVYVT